MTCKTMKNTQNIKRSCKPEALIGLLLLLTLSINYYPDCDQVKATTATNIDSNTNSTLPKPPARIVSQYAWVDDSNQFLGRILYIVGEVVNESSRMLRQR